ncbi:MAG TPA: GrpB family protein [Gemmatimonadaceae bacterium]
MITAYDPLWPLEFEAEADRIVRACYDLPIRLEHIGSTAVPGLSAQPIVDIAAGIPPRAKRQPYIAALRQLGYEHKGAHGIPGRDYFRRGAPRSHQVNLVSWNSELWREWIVFRDFLRTSPETAREFDALKRELSATFADDPRKYAEAKGPFVRAVLRRARAGVD